MSDCQSLANDEMFSAITLLLCSLLKYSRCLLTTVVERLSGTLTLMESFMTFGSLYKENKGPCITAGLCADVWHAWGKAACSFSAQSKSGWTETTCASGRCTLQKHVERNGGNGWLGKESFQNLMFIFILPFLFIKSVLPTKFCDPSLYMRRNCATLEKSEQVSVRTHKQHSTLI